MLAIIAHHYVVNSTVADQFDYNNTSAQQYFLEVWGLWGKTAINSFILISGYFLCTMRLTLQRYMKLIVEVLFYSILIYLIFTIVGYENFSIKSLIYKFVAPLGHINNSFTASFLCFYAFVPFYNKLVDNISHKQLLGLISGLLIVMTGAACFLKANTMYEPLWYMTLYYIAAYFRKYPNKLTESLKASVLLLILSVIVAIAINVLSIYLSNKTGSTNLIYFRNYFLLNSNMPLALIIGSAAFLTFKNMPTFHNRTINFLAAGTFGVLLIHASSNSMRKWLWTDICNVPEMLHAPMGELLLHALSIPLIIFVICSTIDYFRRRFIERPIFSFIRPRIPQSQKV